MNALARRGAQQLTKRADVEHDSKITVIQNANDDGSLLLAKVPLWGEHCSVSTSRFKYDIVTLDLVKWRGPLKVAWYNRGQTKTWSKGTILSNFSTHVESDTEVWHEDKEKTARRLTDQNSACQHISGRRRSSKRRGICDARQRMKETDLKEGRKDC